MVRIVMAAAVLAGCCGLAEARPSRQLAPAVPDKHAAVFDASPWASGPARAAPAKVRGRAKAVRGRVVAPHRWGPSPGGGLVAISCGGKPARVAASAAGKFSAFCSDLAATGYRIQFVGGWRARGSCRGCNMHPRGLAIDINQTGRDRCAGGCPRGAHVNALARKHGLLHGAEWRNADAGHFEVLSRSAQAKIDPPDSSNIFVRYGADAPALAVDVAAAEIAPGDESP